MPTASLLPQSGCCSKLRGQWQLVLLDHGLYRQLDDSFRLEYAGLWHSLVFAGKPWSYRCQSAGSLPCVVMPQHLLQPPPCVPPPLLQMRRASGGTAAQ